VPYDPPQLSELYEKVGRDLRDPAHTTFGLDVLLDFINDGLVELNETKPLQQRFAITDLTQFDDTLPFVTIYRVDSIRTDGTSGENIIPPNNDAVAWQNGWSYFARYLRLPQYMLQQLSPAFDDASIYLQVQGYVDRDALVDDTDVFQGDLEDELLLRRYVKSVGFAALLADRNLYQQWQMQANNTDVSPTQLTNMSGQADQSWRHAKNRAYVIRYPAAGY